MQSAVPVAVALVVCGCLAPSPPAPAEVPSTPAPALPAASGDQPARMTAVLLQGVIVARAPGTGPIPGEGDEASFCFTLPPGSRWLNATLEWDTPQAMGLEFRGPAGHWVSWDGPEQQAAGPIAVSFEDPPPGRWWSYAGPGVAGAAIAWQMWLNVTASPGAEAWDGVVEPEGSRLDADDGCWTRPGR